MYVYIYARARARSRIRAWEKVGKVGKVGIDIVFTIFYFRKVGIRWE